MTALEKKILVKDVLMYMCAYGEGCLDCRFFNPSDDTDGNSFCHIRDKENLVPYDDDWGMNSAMIGD